MRCHALSAKLQLKKKQRHPHLIVLSLVWYLATLSRNMQKHYCMLLRVSLRAGVPNRETADMGLERNSTLTSGRKGKQYAFLHPWSTEKMYIEAHQEQSPWYSSMQCSQSFSEYPFWLVSSIWWAPSTGGLPVYQYTSGFDCLFVIFWPSWNILGLHQGAYGSQLRINDLVASDSDQILNMPLITGKQRCCGV